VPKAHAILSASWAPALRPSWADRKPALRASPPTLRRQTNLASCYGPALAPGWPRPPGDRCLQAEA